MAKTKMIIDCDTGIDDALAITYILANPDIELLGITATYGNVSVDQSAENSLLLTQLLGREDIKVYKGCYHSYETDFYQHDYFPEDVHGHNGIGDVDLGTPRREAEETSAIDFIVDSAKKYGPELHLVFVGPLTNCAECIKKDAEAMKSVGNITIMGGALTVMGNRNIYAEANIGDDPIAAKYVFGSDIKLKIIPLDATLRTLFRVSDIKEWKDINEAGKDLYEIARYYYVHEYGDENIGGAMHDPLAAFASYDPSIISRWYECNMTIEESGRMIGSFEELNLPEKRHKVALDVDASRFTETYIRLVSELIRNNG